MKTTVTAAVNPWVMTLVGALFFAYGFAQMSLFNPLGPQLMDTFSLTVEQFGNISSGYFLAVALMSFPAGILTDKYPSRYLMLSLIVVHLVLLLALTQVTGMWTLAAVRFSQGLVHAFSMLVCVKLASQWISPFKMAIAGSLIVSIGLLGGGLSQPLIAWAQTDLGWKTAVYLDMAVGVIIWVLFTVVIRDNPVYRAQAPSWGAYLQGLKISLSNKQNWLGGAYICLLNLPIILLGTIWGGVYLGSQWGIGEEEAALIASMIFLGMVIGGPLAGLLSDHIHSRRIPLVIGALLSAAVVGILLSGWHLSAPLLWILFFAMGVTTSSQVVIYPVVVEDNPTHYTGSSMAIVATMLMVGNSLATSVFGWILSKSTESISGGGVIYSSGSFDTFIWMMIGLIVSSLLMVYGMKETFGQQPR